MGSWAEIEGEEKKLVISVKQLEGGEDILMVGGERKKR